jgi:hypothetical protein
VVLIMAAVAYFILTRALLRAQDTGKTLAKAVGSDFKGRISVVIYAAGIALAFVHPWFGGSRCMRSWRLRGSCPTGGLSRRWSNDMRGGRVVPGRLTFDGGNGADIVPENSNPPAS